MMCQRLPIHIHPQDVEKEARDLLSSSRRRDTIAAGEHQALDPIAGTLVPRLDDKSREQLHVRQ